MIINGGISYLEKGIKTSIRAMQVQSELLSMANENVNGFDKVGYQRKEAVVSSFTEFLGVNGLSQTSDDKIGRISMSDNPLDLAIATKGYFQTRSAEGVKLTRDGRFKIDKEGNLLTLEDNQVLSNAGVPIKLHVIPTDLKDIKIDDSGFLSVYNEKTRKMEGVATIGVVDANGLLVMEPKVKQGYNEYSNVSLQNEFIGMMPIIRNFEANRQVFMIQNQNLQKVINQLGSAS
ncbi:MAG: flagellar hook basal-body protein [Brachyspira sp.]|uniref:flagellar basal body rod C-terminal domain-containing protein n=1 Tax=Candidatus Scatousia sp. TaxID=3085663 RepID=UPI004025E268|nr:flagellar hook basal-body protein [Brachyspira sp.]